MSTAFQTLNTPRTAEQIFARLSRMEAIDLRRASDDRVRYLARESYNVDGATYEELLKVRDMANELFSRPQVGELIVGNHRN